MRTPLLIAALAAVTLAPAARAAAAQSPEATLDRAVAAYQKVKTVRATFSQTLTNPLLGTTTRSDGEVVQQRPQYIAVRFSDPAGDRVIADGKWVWIYLPSTHPGQVVKAAIGADGAGVPDVTAQFLTAPKSKYVVAGGGTDRVNGRATHVLKLTARDQSLPFTKATVWVDDQDALVRQFETTDASGLVRRVTITNLTINAPVSRSQFAFSPPKGVKVFEQP
ncbi:MAG TPA: outer membrane lipoprotein carrier protein LolA [Gemmatimonadaceae bacterium]|nr:outer membrane lipoprotein carrier protein LolA [Gemmatimonadaceae bacterium]